MRKNQLWTITAAALLTVSLFVMGCSTDASTSGPNPITVEVTATAASVAQGGHVGFTAVLKENGVPVTTGLSYSWSREATKDATAFNPATPLTKDAGLDIAADETGVVTVTAYVVYNDTEYSGSQSVSITTVEAAEAAITAIGTAVSGTAEDLLAALQDPDAGLDQKYVLGAYKAYYKANTTNISAAVTALPGSPGSSDIATAVAALNTAMKTLTQTKLLIDFNAENAAGIVSLLTQENLAALDDDGTAWAGFSALSPTEKTDLADLLVLAKSFSSVADLMGKLYSSYDALLAYKGDLIVTGGTTEANTFYYSVAAEDVTGFTDYISYINTVTSRAAIEFAIDSGSGNVLSNFTTGTDLTGEDRGNKIIVVEYTASTDGTVVAYSATPGTIPESGNANVEVALTPASDPSAILLAPGSYGTAGTTSITGLTSGTYVVLSDGVWHKTVSSGASTLTSTADLVTAMGASVADTTSITGLTSGTTYNVYKVASAPLSAADIKNTIVDASSITTVESVLTAGATATGATVLVYLDAEITPAIAANTTLATTIIPQNSTTIWELSALGTPGTTKIAAANNAKYFTLSTIGAEATLSLTKLTKLSGAITGVTAPVKYETPATNATGPTNTTGTPAITWTKTSGGAAGTAFDVGTGYTATFTLTADTGYTFKGLAADAFTVAGSDTVSVTATGAATVTFAATAGFALADLPASATYKATTASTAGQVSLISGVLTFHNSALKTATINTSSGDGQKINNLLGNLTDGDGFTISAGAIESSTLNTAPSNQSSTINSLFGSGVGAEGVTIGYTTGAAIGGVTVASGKTLTLHAALNDGTKAANVGSGTLTIEAGGTLAGTGLIKTTNEGTITFGSFSGLTVGTATGAGTVASAITDLKNSFDAVTTAIAAANTTVELVSSSSGTAVDAVGLTNSPTIDSGVVLDPANVTVTLTDGALFAAKLDEVTLKLTTAGTGLEVSGSTIDDGTNTLEESSPVPIAFTFSLVKAGVKSSALTLTVGITVDGE